MGETGDDAQCGNCYYSQRDHEARVADVSSQQCVCYYNPPTVQVIPVMGAGNQVQMTTIINRPRVLTTDHSCHNWLLMKDDSDH